MFLFLQIVYDCNQCSFETTTWCVCLACVLSCMPCRFWGYNCMILRILNHYLWGGGGGGGREIFSILLNVTKIRDLFRWTLSDFEHPAKWKMHGFFRQSDVSFQKWFIAISSLHRNENFHFRKRKPTQDVKSASVLHLCYVHLRKVV